MRLTPAQCGMHVFLGHHLRFGVPRERRLVDIVREGHRFLVVIAGVDLGWDPRVWHDHLVATDAGGYRWSNKHRGFPRQINAALADPAWQAAVAELRGAATDPTPDASRADPPAATPDDGGPA